MLWLKWVLGYCLLVAVGLGFGYRSRNVQPSREPEREARTRRPQA